MINTSHHNNLTLHQQLNSQAVTAPVATKCHYPTATVPIILLPVVLLPLALDTGPVMLTGVMAALISGKEKIDQRKTMQN